MVNRSWNVLNLVVRAMVVLRPTFGRLFSIRPRRLFIVRYDLAFTSLNCYRVPQVATAFWVRTVRVMLRCIA